MVWTDHYDEEWQRFPGTMWEFLLDVAAREAPVATAPSAAGPGAGAGPPRWGNRLPENEFPVLSRVLGQDYPPAGLHDWAGFERDLGLVLPSDYRDFIDRYGAGTFCDIRIAGPDASTGFDLRALLRRQLELAQSTPRADIGREDEPAIHRRGKPAALRLGRRRPRPGTVGRRPGLAQLHLVRLP